MTESICGAACLWRKMVCCPISAPILLSAWPFVSSRSHVLCKHGQFLSGHMPHWKTHSTAQKTSVFLAFFSTLRKLETTWQVSYTVLVRPALKMLQRLMFACVNDHTYAACLKHATPNIFLMFSTYVCRCMCAVHAYSVVHTCVCTYVPTASALDLHAALCSVIDLLFEECVQAVTSWWWCSLLVQPQHLSYPTVRYVWYCVCYW